MKSCSKCYLEKNENEFFFRDKKQGRLHAQCKKCYKSSRSKTWEDYYYRKGSQYRERAVARNSARKTHLRLKMFEYLKDKKCEHCNTSNPIVLEFDHIDPKTKSFSISRAINNTTAWEKILKEISKCQILCANCHKIKTSVEQDWFKAKLL